jgi:hypothetical protein
VPLSFAEAERLFRDNEIRTLGQSSDGLLYLKLRSLSRKEYLERLIEAIGFGAESDRAREMFRELYEARVSADEVDAVIRRIYEQERSARRAVESDLVNQLYRVEVFDWGGLRQGGLEKTIVDRYVKKIRSYDELSDKIDSELQSSLRGYVLCSWYNHWTSIIIEDVFRDHPATLPAVGQVKKVDFFLRGVPFDLKVTYLPEEYIADTRRFRDLRPELTILKALARQNDVPFDTSMAKARLLHDLWTKLSDHPGPEVVRTLAELKLVRDQILRDVGADPSPLITWLYEKQGPRRFDAANRLFLILVDTSNYFDSWKLKRAKPLLVARIHSYLDGVGSSPGRDIAFQWTDGQVYEVRSDAVLVIHDRTDTQSEDPG